jgi:basic membrane lipoprotein Med (substrate-binding protein (PBP1-ABC) superfamily)
MDKQIIEYLWQIIDDIDTLSDIAKENDVVYRNMVEKLQKKRWNTGITTDGYKLKYYEEDY